MGKTLTLRGILFEECDCITCGIPFAVPQMVIAKQRVSGGYHHCPNGHSQGWSAGESEIGRTRRERDLLKQQIAQKDDEIKRQSRLRDEAEQAVAAARTQAAKQRIRAHAGLCSCCNRHFSNLERHMASKHKALPVINEMAKKAKVAH